mmetsp:Transcript_63516/g.150491  ORF Transcript_63516/g.150491 Transcript_63516/m.150491 type:complete len:311 (-) Transcript_63516:35-967(-)
MAAINARVPQIEITKLKENAISFILSDTDISMANALRRVMIAEVPTITIDHLEMFNNTSVLSDEFIAHRVGLVPLTSQRVLRDFSAIGDASGAKNILYPRDCDCTGECPNCTVKFSLNVKNNSNETLEVTSKDLISEDPQFVTPVDDGWHPIVIAKLKKNQEIKFRAWAQKGVGRTHAKWSPVATAVFRYEPDIQINNSKMDLLTEQQRQEWVKSCPTFVYGIDPKKRVTVEQRLKCMYCDQCLEKAESFSTPATNFRDLVSVRPMQDRFHFKVESTGALKPEEIVLTALDVLKSKLLELRDLLGEDRML